MKKIIFSFLIVILFFGSLEAIQRIRYSIRWKQPYWLAYGFVRRPADYESKQLEVLKKELGQEFIFVPAQHFKSDYGDYYKYREGKYSLNKGSTILSNGFRDNGPINSNKPTVVCMGGSTTFGVYNKDTETYPYFLSTYLPQYNVLNCGIPQYRIFHIQALLMAEIIKLKPNIIIINNTFNNLVNAAEQYNIQKWDLLTKTHSFLMDKSMFYMTLREKLAYHRKDDLYKVPLNSMLKNFLNGDFYVNLKKILQEISNVCKENNIKLYLVEEPLILNDSSLLTSQKSRILYEKYNEVLSSIENATFIETQRYFNADLMIHDGLHLTEEGNKVMAEIIARQIKKDNVI